MLIEFEDHVLNSSVYTSAEKKLVLTITSLERHSNYYRKKPRDRDWDLLIGNIVAGTQGARTDSATAIFNSVVVEAALHRTI